MSDQSATLPGEVLKTLAKYDSPTICNVIELFGVRPNTSGYMNASIRAIYPKLSPVVGYATTATFRAAFPSPRSDAYKRTPEHIELMQHIPGPRIVVVQDLDEPSVAAILGEVMARLYRRFGCSAFVTNGGVRDLLQVEKLEFPLFAGSVLVSHGYPHFEDLHVPVHVGGLTVRPGDLLHADANGVTSIPLNLATKIAAACEDFVSAETELMDFLESAGATPQGCREAWERISQRLGVMRSKLAEAPVNQ